MDQNNDLLASAENALQQICFAISELGDIQATRHPYNGRAASLAITHLEDARYRVLDAIGSLNAEQNPAVDEKPHDQ
jgi:hypothetical protein